ncbi:MAG: lamin tail domain-containing protein [Myxococcota bacterium]|nr:lamin tail domain-containing protein [Myxococcota bacterium]
MRRSRAHTARPRATHIALALALAAGCATGGAGELDAGRADAGRRDGGRTDAGDAGDAGRRDAGDAAIAIDAGVDAAMALDASVDAGTDSGFDAGVALCPPTAERLGIVEVMISSRSGSTDRGEWLELLNVGDCAVDLTGLVIASPPSGMGVAIEFSLPGGTILPGARWVLAQSAVPLENHDLPHDAVYSGITLDNGGDWIELRAGGVTIDRVSWGSTDFLHGTARSFPDGRPLVDNASQLQWCNATAVYSMATGGPYRGTPRAPNGACP